MHPSALLAEPMARHATHRRGSPGTRAGTAAALLALAAGTAAATPTAVTALPPLAALGASLADAEPLPRLDFARIALDEMHFAYAREVAAIVKRGGALPLADPRVRWAASVRAYAQRLHALAEDLDEDTPVEIVLAPPAAPKLVVAGRAVVLSGPRISEPDAMGARIVARWCARWLCEPALSETPPERAGPPPAQPSWSFGDHERPRCLSADGLTFEFRDLAGLERKRAACSTAVAELRALAAALRTAMDRGVRVEWDVVEVVPLGPDREDHLRLNRAGEYQPVELRALARAPRLQRRAMAWVRARSQGRPLAITVTDADTLLADVGDDPGRSR